MVFFNGMVEIKAGSRGRDPNFPTSLTSGGVLLGVDDPVFDPPDKKAQERGRREAINTSEATFWSQST